VRALPLPGSPSTDAQTWRQAPPRSERFLQLQRRTHTRTDHSSLSLQCAISTTKNQHCSCAFAISETTGLGIKPPTRIISKTDADNCSSVAIMNRVFVTLFETGAWTTNWSVAHSRFLTSRPSRAGISSPSMGAHDGLVMQIRDQADWRRFLPKPQLLVHRRARITPQHHDCASEPLVSASCFALRRSSSRPG
jgi:hypothetical protein